MTTIPYSACPHDRIRPNSDFETGVGINALIGADSGSRNGGAVFHDSAVWVHRASQPRDFTCR
jgi:hypothetical protein